MKPPSRDSDAWVRFARANDLDSWIGFLLDALEPLAILGAQAVYMIGPVVGLRESTTRSLGHVLEDRQEREALRRRLTADPHD
jgi:hypothetical protein